jgi:hypothetical protein
MTTLTRSLVALAVVSAPVLAQQPRLPAQSATEWRRMWEQGVTHKSAAGLYASLKKSANGGQAPGAPARLPDWSGLWTVGGGSGLFDPAPDGTRPKLTPAAADALRKGAELLAKGIEYDENLSQCGPPGFPRWLVIPFLREFIVRPEQTWLTSETVNNVRRIYTDGRDHLPEEDRYPLYYGDSVGFWDNQKLVIHTNQLMARNMGRNQPDQSEAMETVEIWEKVNPGTITAHVWVWDPAIYTEPWYLRRVYTQVPNPDRRLRINYWFCGENPNNDVVKTPDGSTQFKDFSFTNSDDKK